MGQDYEAHGIYIEFSKAFDFISAAYGASGALLVSFSNCKEPNNLKSEIADSVCESFLLVYPMAPFSVQHCFLFLIMTLTMNSLLGFIYLRNDLTLL